MDEIDHTLRQAAEAPWDGPPGSELYDSTEPVMAATTTTPSSVPAAHEDGAGSPRATKILDTATRLFAANGYANVGMRAIADVVGVRPASLYYHFSSKEAILYALSLRVTQEFIEETAHVLGDIPEARAALHELLRKQIVFSWENRDATEVSRREMHELSPEHLNEVLFHRARYRRMIQSHIETGVRNGDFHAESPRLAGLAILSMANGVNDWFNQDRVTREVSPGALKIEDVASTYADMIVNHLLQ